MKLKVIYTPDGQPSQEWEFDPDELTSLEAETAEEAGGNQWNTLSGWLDHVRNGGFRAMRVFVWLMLSRDNPELDLNQVQPKVKEISFRLPDEEPEPGKDEAVGESTDSESPNAA